MIKRKLVLENGTVFQGIGFGSDKRVSGDVIFNTAMTGYQEIISNPSNYGTIIVMTSPTIGVCGINRDDFEAVTPSINGLITRAHCEQPTNFRSDITLNEFLKEYDIPGIYGVDTRMLTRYIRKHGIMKGKIINDEVSNDIALKEIKRGTGKVQYVSTKQAYSVPGRKERIVVIDLGMKHGILRELTKRNCQVTIVPYSYPAEKIERLKPNGVVLSNGPGDPNDISETIETIKSLRSIPMFGIGLGHQVIGLAYGASVIEMKYGKHGNNYPVKDIAADRAYMTTQNHHYTLSQSSIMKTEFKVTFKSVGEEDVLGLQHTKRPIVSVQFYPDGGPGPDDMTYLYDHFLKLIQNQPTTVEEDLHA